MTADDSSITILFERWQSGDRGAGEELYRRYVRRLWRRAEQLIGERLARRYSPEDAANSALGSFLRRAGQGEYQIAHSGALWRLLETILRHKIAKQGGKAQHEIPLPADVIAREPSHEAAVDVADRIETALEGMRPRDAEICRLRLEEHSVGEIAAQVDCSRWTVRRAVKRFSERIADQLSDGAETR